MGRKVARIVALLLLLVTGYLGIHNGIVERANRYSPFQRSVYVGVILYGVLGLVTAYAVIRHRRWGVRTATAWAVMITYVSATAALAYAGDDASLVGAVAAGMGAGLIGAGVIWAVREAPVPDERRV
jgi:hypothetical protein